MAREITLMASSTGSHYLLFGLNQNELSSFAIQLWLEKHGTRAVDWLQSLSLGFCSFMGGNVYIHNSNEVPRCNLFGEQKECKIGIVVNEQPTQKKILDSIGIETDAAWEVESIVIPPELNHPDGMYSIIPKNKFKKRDGIYRSDFLRNMKTSGSTIKAIEAITGEPLRCHEAYIILKNTDVDKVQIWSVEINMTSSKN
jgi:hypothetical protein